MNIAGTWKVKKIMSFANNEPTMITIEEFQAIPDKAEDMTQMAASMLKISEDGILQMLIPVPAEALAQAKEEGAVITDDGFIVAETFELINRDGAIFCSNEGMESDPMPLKIDDEGGLEFMGVLLIFEMI